MNKLHIRAAFLPLALGLITSGCISDNEPANKIDWGHWRLGQKADLEFLVENHMTVTFGSGAPNFEYVSRAQFDRQMEEAKTFNKAYHDKGYIVLRYLSTSLEGETQTSTDQPEAQQIDLLEFYNNRWSDFADYLGIKPAEDPTTWITINQDGSFPHYRYAPYGQKPGRGFETWGCPHNPDYVRWMEGRIRAQAETGIDGSYIDWTHMAGGTCYCTYTHQTFIDYLTQYLPISVAEAKYAHSSPDYSEINIPQQSGDDFWMEWLKFRGHSVAEFHKRMRTVAREYNPEFLISGNVFGGFGYGPIAYDAAGNIEMLGRDGYDDFIYSEIQEYLDSAPRKEKSGNKITNSPALKFLAAATHGKPVIVYATEITPPIFPDPTEKCLSAMAQMNIAEATANQAIFREKRLTPPGATTMYRFLAKCEEYLVGARLWSNIAVLASLNQYLADELSFAFSMSRVLADNGISHVMIVEDDLLSRRINDYDVIILPYLPLLSVEKQKALRRYVHKGGTLLILGRSGVKNEHKLLLDDSILAGLLGAQDFPPHSVTKDIKWGRIVYIPLEIPASKFLIPSNPGEDATTFGPAMTDVFPDIPEGYTRNRMDPQLREILDHISRSVPDILGGRVSRVFGNPYIEMTTMLQKKSKRVIVHLVNYDVTIDGNITLARNLKVDVLIPEGAQPTRVLWGGSLSELESIPYSVSKRDDRAIVEFEPDVMGIYGLAVIE